jgi:RNA polymerase sigma factor (sigma-70 family)
MESTVDKKARCVAMIAIVDKELNWGLDEAKRQEYAANIQTLVPAAYPDLLLRKLIENYHKDYKLVQTLLDCNDPEHDAAWLKWSTSVLAILRQAGLGWSGDTASDTDDLVQVALAQLVRALPSFRYTSRFSTWAYSVITQSIRRYIRDQQASKRAGRPLSLEQHPEIDTLHSAEDQPEQEVAASALAELIEAALAGQPDARLARIFELWVRADMRPEEIGQDVQLSSSRVRVLLAQAREALRRHHSILAWIEAETRKQGE